MESKLSAGRQWASKFQHIFDRAVYSLSAYVVPAAIALVSLVALLGWDNHYPSDSGDKVSFKLLPASSSSATPESALAVITGEKETTQYDTRLSEKPIWLLLKLEPTLRFGTTIVEFPSRHATSLACWDAGTLKELGSGSREGTHGMVSLVKAGFALSVGSLSSERTVLCLQKFVGPARISIAKWPEETLIASARAFERYSGLLDGGLIVLGLFVTVTAVINRESSYLLFAAWLLLNLRMAALSSGWDLQWLGHTVPPNWLLLTRALTLALYYVLTVTLFRTLFREELTKTPHTRLLKLTHLLCAPVLLSCLLLPYGAFLPILWASTAYTSIVLIYFLSCILKVAPSPVAFWYTASLTITLIASLYEVISAALGLRGLIGSINSVTAALSSSLLAAFAIAEQLRIKHQQWLEAQAELQHTYEAMPIGLFTLDPTGHFISSNPAFRLMVSAANIQVGSDKWEKYFEDNAWQKLERTVHSHSNSELEIECNCAEDNEKRRFLVKATLARGKIEGSLQDITARAKATDDLQFMAHNDPLTKVLNRRGIDAVISTAVAEINDESPLMLAYLDLDRFKLINDLYGHTAGDEVLKQVCDRINSMLTGSQRVGRVGGDEFVIVFPGTPMAVASWVCRGLVDCIGNGAYHIGDKAFQVRGSIGLIEVVAATKIKDAISTADRACREAKSSNNGLVIYERNASAFRDREAELALVEKIANAGAPEGLFLEMQPIMSLKHPHESLNFEVLLRMRNDDGSVIPAGRIVSAAEGSGRIGMIDRWVLATTLAWINTHHGTLDRTQFICMNLSGASLNDERFVLDAFDILEKNRYAAGFLCLEITESIALHDLANTRRFIDQVRGYGVKIALDDFGAGYTSFSYLKDLPADVLKIDGGFIVNMNLHPANVAIVEAIVNLAGNLGMKTIAEWAEDNATVQTLVEIGVDYVQGYAVSRPQLPEAILAAASSASFIKDRELAAYADTLSQLSVSPPPMPTVVTLISSDGKLVSK
jgi:diguanylate cyclase (GGDEF)-like protein